MEITLFFYPNNLYFYQLSPFRFCNILFADVTAAKNNFLCENFDVDGL